MKNGLIIDKYENKRWYLNDKLHREDGPAVKYTDGSKCWYLNGKRHREDGPAVEYADGEKLWYLNGERHRENGPAVEFVDGDKLWYLNGIEYSEEEYWTEIKKFKLEKKTIETNCKCPLCGQDAYQSFILVTCINSNCRNYR